MAISMVPSGNAAAGGSGASPENCVIFVNKTGFVSKLKELKMVTQDAGERWQEILVEAA
jgi:hypothetical protein